MARHELDNATVTLLRFDETTAPTYAQLVDGAAAASHLTATPTTDPMRVVDGPSAIASRRSRWFNGTTHYGVSSAADAALVTALTGNWSFMAWIRPETTGARRYLFSYTGPNGALADDNTLGGVAIENSGAVVIFQESGAGTNQTATQTAGTFFSNSTWQHIAVTKSGTTFKIYRNGVLQDTLTVSASDNGGGANSRLYIGQSGRSTSFYKGSLRAHWLDNVVSDQAAVTAAAARPNYDHEPTGSVWYYECNESADAIDESTYGQHLRLHGCGINNISAVDTAADTVTLTSHKYATGDGPVQLVNSGGALPTGLSAATDYWLINAGPNLLAFATSQANALLGTRVNITGAGSGTNVVLRPAYLGVAPTYAESLADDDGYSRVFDGTKELDSFLAHPTTAALLSVLQGDCTVEAWVKPHRITPEVVRGLMVFGDPEFETSASNFFGVQWNGPATGWTGFMESGSGTDQTLQVVYDFYDAVHVAVVKVVISGSAYFKIYINGVLLALSGALTNFDGGSEGFLRVATGPSESGWKGIIDDLRISNRERTKAEILEVVTGAAAEEAVTVTNTPVSSASHFEPGVDLELDSDGDLVVDTDLHFTTGLAAVAQGIRLRIQTFKGEWFLDLDHGVPYFQDLLGQKFNEAKARAAFRDAILSAPEIDSLDSLTVTFNGQTRVMAVSWRVTTSFGQVADSIDLGG